MLVAAFVASFDQKPCSRVSSTDDEETDEAWVDEQGAVIMVITKSNNETLSKRGRVDGISIFCVNRSERV